MDNQAQNILTVQNLFKNYQTGASDLPVLKGLSFEIKQGEAVCLLGSSGAGKSTLLQILGTLDRPTSGEVLYRGQNLFELDDESLAEFRNQKMGLVAVSGIFVLGSLSLGNEKTT